MTRRRFAAATFASALLKPAAARPQTSRFVKGICSAVFPAGTPYADCFRVARNAGFEAIEIRMETGKGEITPESGIEQMHKLREAAEARKIQIASLWILTPRSPSLASPDPNVRRQAVHMVKKGIELAPALGCGALLVAAGVLGSGARFEVTHDDAWAHASAAYREVLPLASAAKVMLTPENVWSKFLVSPRDMRSFIDQFQSPWVRSHFDVGNVMQYGYPQDWILTLAERIKRVHLKDYKLGWGARREGSCRCSKATCNGKRSWRLSSKSAIAAPFRRRPDPIRRTRTSRAFHAPWIRFWRWRSSPQTVIAAGSGLNSNSSNG